MKKILSMVTVLALLCVMFTTSALARQEVRTSVTDLGNGITVLASLRRKYQNLCTHQDPAGAAYREWLLHGWFRCIWLSFGQTGPYQ